MWELDYKESWGLKNWCSWTVVLEKTLESPLDCKEIQPVHPKGDQSWIFIGRTDVEAETPILWPPDEKVWLIGKDSNAGKDWRWEEKGTTEDEMVGWHRQLYGHEFEQAPGVGDGQGGLERRSPWGGRESDTTEQLTWTERTYKVGDTVSHKWSTEEWGWGSGMQPNRSRCLHGAPLCLVCQPGSAHHTLASVSSSGGHGVSLALPRGHKPHQENHKIKTFCAAVSPHGCHNPLAPVLHRIRTLDVIEKSSADVIWRWVWQAHWHLLWNLSTLKSTKNIRERIVSSKNARCAQSGWVHAHFWRPCVCMILAPRRHMFLGWCWWHRTQPGRRFGRK